MIAKFVLIFILQNIAMFQTVASLNISILSKQLVLRIFVDIHVSKPYLWNGTFHLLSAFGKEFQPLKNVYFAN